MTGRRRSFVAMVCLGAVAAPGAVRPAVVQRSGGEFQVPSYTSGYQGATDLAVAAGGDFLVVWQSYGQDGASGGIFAQRWVP